MRERDPFCQCVAGVGCNARQRSRGPTHDALDWPAFSSLGAALNHAKEHNGDLVITDAHGDTVTLDDVTKQMLSAAQSSDFKWG